MSASSRARQPSRFEAPTNGFAARRVDMPCRWAGFVTPPPCRVQLKFLPRGDTWSVLGLTAPGKPDVVARWLQPFGPVAVDIAPGVAPKVVRAHFDRLPASWEWMLSEVAVHYLELTPEGAASVFIHDSPEHVQRFIAGLPGDPAEIRQRTVDANKQVRLTPRQLEVLSLAVALGYYETPHRLSLRDLAGRMNVSVAAVAELLRRGESLIITHYIDSLSAATWGPAFPVAGEEVAAGQP